MVYGVAGEGLGHAARARVLAAHLEAEGHDVKIVSYERGYHTLKDDFDCFEAEGLHIGIRDNKVAPIKSLVENLRKAPRILSTFREVRRRLFDEFQPHAVVTDFEPMTAYLARFRKLPLIAIDNQHAMRYMHVECPRRLLKDRIAARWVVRLTVPPPDVALISTFFSGELRNDRTFVFGPILRETVLQQTPVRGDHVLVYHTRPYDSFLEQLQRFPNERFLVYGYNRSGEEGPVTHKPFSVDGFLHDLVTCKAVMATAGFTLLTEALHLGKPMLATPQNGQFEQELNAVLLERMGYGLNARILGDDTIGDFLNRLPELEHRLQDYARQDNSAIKVKLSELVSNDCAGAKAYRAQRLGKAPEVESEMSEGN
jgi:uncharacterized protein (TIGR00661 family)